MARQGLVVGGSVEFVVEKRAMSEDADELGEPLQEIQKDRWITAWMF
jgi:hypothetical protein